LRRECDRKGKCYGGHISISDGKRPEKIRGEVSSCAPSEKMRNVSN